MKRRQLVKLGAAFGAAAFVGFPGSLAVQRTPRAYADQSTSLKKFAQPLRGVGPGGIPVALPDAAKAPVTGAVHYTLSIGEFQDKLHPDLSPTTLWGYSPKVALGEGAYPQRHLGGIVVAQKGTPIQLTFTNQLPSDHILPVDTSMMFPDAAARFGGSGMNAACTHLHGGFVPWISDGGPMAWFNPIGNYGPSIADKRSNLYRILNPNLMPGQAEYYYPNQQSARMMWYHDHAHDITRLNAYAGIATAYILRDSAEADLKKKGLPEFVENGGREIPLVIQDKFFVGSDIQSTDPSWFSVTPDKSHALGSLWYPHVYNPADVGENATETPPDPSCLPEMFGDTMLVNGTVYPEATVEARRYRLRILNACQSRVLNLQLYVEDGSKDGITLATKTMTVAGSDYTFYEPTNAAGPDFVVIGTEGGFLPQMATVPSGRPLEITQNTDDPDLFVINGGSLITAPAERWDVIVDFSGFVGKKLIVYNDAPAPFPGGDPTTDYFPGAPENPVQPQPGYGPNTRQLMRFKVVRATSKDQPLTFGAADLQAGLDPFLVAPTTSATPTPLVGSVVSGGHVANVRTLTLNEDYDQPYGRLIQRLGTNVRLYSDTFGRNYMDPATETPNAGSIEVWQIVNTTGDTHPIHFHLANVQILSRRPFNLSTFNGTPEYVGPAYGPDPTELGWKETVKMHPGEVTTVIMKFNLPKVLNSRGKPIEMPTSLNPDLKVNGYEYVWHCHILEHEEHDMMRPMVVLP